MRLITGILWSLATLLWLPWFTALTRFLADLAMGVAPAQSAYLNPALISLWPVRGWLDWGIVSWVPVAGLAAMLLVYIGWRFFWWEQDWRVTHRAPLVILSILLPPLALILLYRDARRRFRQRNASLAAAAREAREQLGEQDALRLLS